jgi:hypothetical protein
MKHPRGGEVFADDREHGKGWFYRKGRNAFTNPDFSGSLRIITVTGGMDVT